MSDSLQGAAAQVVRENLDHDDVKAYLDKDHERHDEVVSLVTKLVEDVFGTPHHKEGLLDNDEDSIRRELYDDDDSVSAQLQKILQDPSSKWHKAYFDSNNPLHAEAVRRVQILSEAKYGDDTRVDPDSRMPITHRTAVNVHQIGAFPNETE
jgi:hypothetical protein